MAEPPSDLVELVNPDGRAPVLLLCDHADRVVPGGLATLGVGAADLDRHIGWDIGAAALTRALATGLDAPALLCLASRLYVDANRRPGLPSSMPSHSDGTLVPGNRTVAPEEVRDRLRRAWLPYHRAIARRIADARRAGAIPALIAVHSFTPRINGVDRPWQVGVLWRGDRRLSQPVLEALRARGDLVVGDNQPYSGQADFGYTITFHAQRTRLPHLMLEIRQDEIADPPGVARWTGILLPILAAALARPGIHRLHAGDLREHLGAGRSWRDACRSAPLPR
jgi:predicted N-formylglutamate amidohydrolase